MGSTGYSKKYSAPEFSKYPLGESGELLIDMNGSNYE
jgi:hypothetical protein